MSSPNPQSPRLEIANVTAGYPTREGHSKVLNSVDMTVAVGEAVAIMGSSGSGKTTFLNCIAGLMPAQFGSIKLDGTELTSKRQKQLDDVRRTKFGFVYQEYNLVDALSAAQNVQLPTFFTKETISHEKALSALEAVNLGSHANRKPGELSGGQQQRVAIARVLAVPRQAVFADEPTGALDRESSRLVIHHLLALTELGTSVVLVTHDPVIAARADRVVFLQDGEIDSIRRGGDPFDISQHLTRMETST